MKKEKIILKKGDKVYYTWNGIKDFLIVGASDGATIKEIERDGSKITKIERPEYKTIYEAPKEILDKEEKEYLEAVLRPFRNRSVTIKKIKTRPYMKKELKEFLFIALKNDDILLPSFRENTMYKGMEAGKRYTLEELGLFEGE